MHLLIIGHTAHYIRDGQPAAPRLCGAPRLRGAASGIVGWGPTVKEIDWLAQAFDRVTHLACLHDGPAPPSALPYRSDRVRCVFVPPAGGLSAQDKSRVLLYAPAYVRSILQHIPPADVVHVRCPGSLGMYGMVLASLFRGKQAWFKYAGNWAESGRMPLSFRFQRGWLRAGLGGGPVTINGRWPNQPDHVFTFDNPSLTLDDVRRARNLARAKSLASPIRFVFAGRTETAKGLGTALQIVATLRAHCPELVLDVLGDGPERPAFERMSHEMGLASVVQFHSWVPHDRVSEHLAQAHFVLLPSSASEGWPKVLSEAMAHGAVPIASQVSAIPQVLAEIGSGAALPANDVAGFVRAIQEIASHPRQWREMVEAGLGAAPRFTYERYLVRLDETFKAFYGSSPFDTRVIQGFRAPDATSGAAAASQARA